MKREIICISCPVGCRLTAEYTDISDIKITGNMCNRGLEYGKSEIIAPKRPVASTVRISGGEIAMAPVRTSVPVPKNKIFDVLEALKSINLAAPVKRGDAVIKDVLGTGADIIVTRTIKPPQGK
jgi:Uncharacterized protein with conserved CXXC pairs